VLTIDPTADISRFVLVACYLEVDEPTKAVATAKSFHDQSTRWALAAATIIELDTGSIPNATVQLANLKRSNPTWGLVSLDLRSFHVWRKVDWDLFDKTLATPKK
jgi:hypothetical protein